jgi:hypothetical protein
MYVRLGMGSNSAVKVRYTLGSRKRRTFGPKLNGKGVHRVESEGSLRTVVRLAKSRTLPRASGFLTESAYKAV